MNNKYLLDNGIIEGVENETTIKQLDFYKFDCKILITQEKED